MKRRIVFDTNVASAEFKNRLPPVLAAKMAGSDPVLAFVVRAELLKWTHVRSWGAASRASLHRWIAEVPLLPGEESVTDVFAVLSAAADLRGRPRPENDMWIAACCLAHDLPLATLNVKDFDDFRIHHGLSIVTA